LIRDIWGDDLVVHVCLANRGLTSDGIESGATRLAQEVREIITTWDAAGIVPRSISFWGHSLGGLYIRCALAQLADVAEGTVCGLPAKLLLTTACPHLSVAMTFTGIVQWLSSGWYGLTSQQLFLEDEEAFVIQLGTEDRYLQPLQLFEQRALIANVANDPVVDFCTSALQPCDAPWLLNVRPIREDFPHVIYDNNSWVTPVPLFGRTLPEDQGRSFLLGGILFCGCQGSRGKVLPDPDLVAPEEDVELYFAGHEHEKALEAVRQRLSKIPWRVVCARFPSSTGSLLSWAHYRICYDPESDVVRYICDTVMRGSFGNAVTDAPIQPLGIFAYPTVPKFPTPVLARPHAVTEFPKPMADEIESAGAASAALAVEQEATQAVANQWPTFPATEGRTPSGTGTLPSELDAEVTEGPAVAEATPALAANAESPVLGVGD